MFDKRWLGLVIIGASILAWHTALAGARTRVDSMNLGRVNPGQLASRLQLHPDSTLQAGSARRLDDGHRLVRMRQLYKGVPVYGRSVVVEWDRRGNVVRVKGLLEHDLARELANVTPRLTPAQARRALQRVNQQLRQQVHGAKAQLFVYADGRSGQGARLVYRVSYLIGTRGRMARPTALIDAHTGKVIKQWSGLTYGRRSSATAKPVLVHVVGPGGNDKTGIYHYDGSTPERGKLRVTRVGNACYMKNPRVVTYDLAGGTSPVLWSFGCPAHDPSQWISAGDAINGAFSPINDAAYFAEVTYKMYEDWFSQPPLVNPDGSPMKLAMWVHYGTGFDNAFWDGWEMIFGDGGSDDYPVVALDVTAHEISHGFTEQHSGLEYVDQSGGMNEAFSDMAGAAAAYFANGKSSSNFLVGEDIVKPGTGSLEAWRSMCDPTSNGHAIDHANDFTKGMDPHDSSGVYNKAFCTLAKTSGWNIKKAFEVFHDANAYYWGPQETFDGGACGVESAADDRGFNKGDVVAAFAVVGVACQSGGFSSTTSSPAAPAPAVPRHSAGPVHQRSVDRQPAQATRPSDTGLR